MDYFVRRRIKKYTFIFLIIITVFGIGCCSIATVKEIKKASVELSKQIDEIGVKGIFFDIWNGKNK